MASFTARSVCIVVLKILAITSCSVCSCGCLRTMPQKYSREITPQKNRDESLRKELVYVLDRIIISRVSLKGVAVEQAIDWLSANGQQTICVINFGRADQTYANSVVTIEMSRVTFLEVLDEICRQSSRYWGFKGRVLMTLPKSYVDGHPDEWNVRTGSHQIRPLTFALPDEN
jgi:hypothetical protein